MFQLFNYNFYYNGTQGVSKGKNEGIENREKGDYLAQRA